MSTPTDTTTTKEILAAGWQALARTEWDRARSLFEAAVGRDESAEALEGLSLAAWWLDDAETMFTTRERAYRLYRRDGDAIDHVQPSDHAPQHVAPAHQAWRATGVCVTGVRARGCQSGTRSWSGAARPV